MATVDVNGTLIDFPDDLTPDQLQAAVSSAASQMGGNTELKKIAPKSVKGFASNYAKDFAQNAGGAAELAAYSIPALAALKSAGGENIYDSKRLKTIGEGAVAGVKDIPKNLLKTITSPIESAYERPVSTGLDLASLLGTGAAAANIGRKAVASTAQKVGPGLARGAAGIPENLTEMVLRKPSILKQAPVGEDSLNNVVGKPIIDAMQATKKAIGQRFGEIFKKYAGMEGPMKEIVDTPIAQKLTPIKSDVAVAQKLVPTEVKRDMIQGGGSDTKLMPGEMITESKVTGFKPGEEITVRRPENSYDELLVNKNRAERAFKEGDTGALKKLFKEYVGTPKSNFSASQITDKDKLQILTRLKRETQRQATFNKAPITNAPIDTAKDAAFKKISSDLDATRSKLPKGQTLAWADDAWKSINDIFDTVQKDLSDPGKAKDTMMRIARGDNTWLTSGRMKTKVDTIRKVERMTQSKILEPAMEELARQVFSQNMGKGFFPNAARTAATAIAGFGAGTANPAALVGSGLMLGSTSPKLIGKAIQAGSAVGGAISKLAPLSKASAASSAPALASIKKTLTEEKVREYLRRFKGNPEKARQQAKADGYTPE